jgi:hypothetical protein
MAISIYIPLDQHLIKYMKVEAMRPNGTYKVLVSSIFGNFILNMLEQSPEGCRMGPPDESHLEFKISERYCDGRGTYISDKNMEILTRMIRQDYKKEFQLFVREHHVKWGHSYNVAAVKWRERYGITEDDRKLETDLKNIYRKNPQKLSKDE